MQYHDSPYEPARCRSSGSVRLSIFFFFSSRRRHTRYWRDWSSDVCSSDLVAAGAGDHHRLHGLVLLAGPEEVGELAVAVERERVLPLRPVQRHGRDLALDAKEEVRRTVAAERQRDGVGGSAHACPPSTARRAEALALARRRRSSSTSRRDRSSNISATQSS